MKVEINHLTKVIQGNVVLDDINACFSCASGENGGRIYGIQGINGSGKTIVSIWFSHRNFVCCWYRLNSRKSSRSKK